jgi:carboxyl-terminal processing protease
VRRGVGYLAALVLVAGAFALGFFLTQADSGASQSAPPVRSDRPLRLIDEVRAELTSVYFRWIDPAVLERPTVDGILAGLEDPHTDLLTNAEYESLQEHTQGTYSGIGLTVGPVRKGLVVTSAAEGPAAEAGIRKGDVITRIDGEPVGELAFESALALIKGHTGTVVGLTVKRRKVRQPLEFTLVRREIDVPPLSAQLVTAKGKKLASIRVFSFSAGAAAQIEEATAELVEKGATVPSISATIRRPASKLSIASVFIDDGSSCARTAPRGAHEYHVTGSATQSKLPLVVLVNSGSASAAEIVAGALVDHHRAVLVGQRTFGKASVQTVAPLLGGGALKLTTAKYLMPAGADITNLGLEPSVVAADDPTTRPDEGLRIARRTLVETLNRLVAGARLRLARNDKPGRRPLLRAFRSCRPQGHRGGRSATRRHVRDGGRARSRRSWARELRAQLEGSSGTRPARRARAAAAPRGRQADRVDLRHLFAFTIDPEAPRIDDALTFQREEGGVRAWCTSRTSACPRGLTRDRRRREGVSTYVPGRARCSRLPTISAACGRTRTAAASPWRSSSAPAWSRASRASTGASSAAASA